jgi:hypothetical protein
MSIAGGRSGAAAALCVVALLVGASPAAADCASVTVDGAFRDATSVFVGEVSGRRGDHVRFETAEVWRGPDLAEQVWVRTDNGSAPLDQGGRYLVGAAEGFLTGDCLLWPADATEVTDARPLDVRAPAEGGSAGAEPPPGLRTVGLVGLGAATVLGGAFVLVRRSRRAPDDRVATYGPGA